MNGKVTPIGNDRIRVGRIAPYVQIAHWVMLADVSKAAKTLYVLLHMHVNTMRGDRAVWPKRAFLARILGHKRPQSLEKYFHELIALNAIEMEREYFKDRPGYRHIYTVHETPPAGYDGFLSLEDAYDEWRMSNEGGDATKSNLNYPKSGSSSNQEKRPVSAVQPNYRKTVSSKYSKNVSSNYRKTVTELYEDQLDEFELKEVLLPSVEETSFPLSISPTNKRPQRTERRTDTPCEENKTPTPMSEELTLIAHQVEWGRCTRPSKQQAAQMVKAIHTAMKEGWTLAQLRRHIAKAITEVKDPKKAPKYVLGALTEHLPVTPPQAKPKNTHQIYTGATEASPGSPTWTVLSEAVKKALKAAETQAGHVMKEANAQAHARALLHQRLEHGHTMHAATNELAELITAAATAINPKHALIAACQKALKQQENIQAA